MTTETPLRARRDTGFSALADEPLQSPLFTEEENLMTSSSVLADYRQRYGLQEDPFTNDYSFPLFTGAERRQLLDKLLHLVQFSNNILAVTGAKGVGKTRIAHGFMDSLSSEDIVSYLPLDKNSTAQMIFSAVVEDFELDLHGEPIIENLVASVDHWLTLSGNTSEQLACVVIDNAQFLGSDTLDVIANLLRRHPEQRCLHFVLLGEQGLSLRLRHFDQQGLGLNAFELAPLQLGECVDYLNFRMEMADYLGPEVFTESMVSTWFRQIDGDISALHSKAQERLLQSVITPSGAVLNKRPLPLLHIFAISGLIALVGILMLYMQDDEPESGLKSVAIAPPSPTSGRDLTKTNTPLDPVMPLLPNSTRAPVSGSVPAATQPIRSDLAPSSNTTPPIAAQPAVAATPEPVSEPVVKPVVQAPPKPQAPVVTAPTNQTPAVKPVALPPKAATTALKSLDEKTILGWPTGTYTIQLLGVSSERAAREYIASQSNKADLLLFKSLRQGKDWFVVVTGRFASSAAAREGIARLPVAQRDAGPWPREVKAIQTEIMAVR